MKLSLNLASRSYLNRRALYVFYTGMIGVLVLLLILNLGFLLRSQFHTRQIKVRLAELDQNLAGRQEGGKDFDPAAYDRLLADIAFANEILAKDSFRWTALLDRLEEVVPQKVVIRGIQPDYKGGGLNLTGQARQVADLRGFLDSLIRSPDFSEVYLLQQERETTRGRKGGKQAGINFTIVVKGAF